VLYGRRSECAALDDLVAAARAGISGAVLLRGHAGVGKSALLDYAARHATGMTVLRATGVQSESELPYAGLHQMVRPVVDRIDALPDVQRDALRAALGLVRADGVNRLLVGAGLLTLLGELADGVLCVVDDLHWLDRASADALVFAARRLGTEGVAMLLGARPDVATGDHRGGPPLPPELRIVDIAGLSAQAAGELLSGCAPAPPVAHVVDRLTALTDGHPLALRELARLLSPAQLAGRSPLPDPLPLPADLQRVFLDQARRLSPAAQLALLVAATDTSGRLTALLAAVDRLRIEPAAVLEAEQSGLVRIDPGTGVAFRHPLVRSAVVAGASFTQRRLVHQTLAAVLTDPAEVDRRVWHAAAAALGHDDEVADALEAAAGRSTSRGAHVAAATALRRAAELSAEPGVAVGRHVAAARAAWLAGQADLAYAALDSAHGQATDVLQVAQIAELRGLVTWRQGDAWDAHTILVQAAPTIADRRPAMAARMLVHATEAASWYGDLAGVLRCGALAEAIRPGDDPDAAFHRNYASGLAAALAGDPATAQRRLAVVIEQAERQVAPDRLTWAAKAAMFLGRLAEAAALAQRATAAARNGAMTGLLVHALEMSAVLEYAQGSYPAATALGTEGATLARETGQDSSAALLLAGLAATAAVRGDDDRCQEAAAQALALAGPRRLGLAAGAATHALAQLDLVHGRYAAALQRLDTMAAAGPGEASLSVSMMALPDHVEAAVGAGAHDSARQILQRLQLRSAALDSPRLRALLLRCRALVGDGDIDELFTAAVAAHPVGEAPLELARTRLLYGQWLRRARRHAAAREHLRAALLDLERLGCRPLAERARGELRATGETVGNPEPADLHQLTPQELTVVRLVTEGLSTKEVAARLFLSPRTVEYHLHKVYPKFGVRSRTELAHVLAGQAQT